jgi:hypothetical protein
MPAAFCHCYSRRFLPFSMITTMSVKMPVAPVQLRGGRGRRIKLLRLLASSEMTERHYDAIE